MRPKQQKSGTVRCQRCLKFGHYTYECQNEVAYRYRPSRTVMFKQQIKMALNQDKGPQTVIRNPDKQRRIEDRPSSSDEDQKDDLKPSLKAQIVSGNIQQVKFEDNQNQQNKPILDKQQSNQQKSENSSSSSSSQSQSSSSESSSSSSSSSSSDSDEDSAPQKRRKP